MFHSWMDLNIFLFKGLHFDSLIDHENKTEEAKTAFPSNV